MYTLTLNMLKKMANILYRARVRRHRLKKSMINLQMHVLLCAAV